MREIQFFAFYAVLIALVEIVTSLVDPVCGLSFHAVIDPSIDHVLLVLPWKPEEETKGLCVGKIEFSIDRFSKHLSWIDALESTR